jgi:hypothetical protein
VFFFIAIKMTIFVFFGILSVWLQRHVSYTNIFRQQLIYLNEKFLKQQPVRLDRTFKPDWFFEARHQYKKLPINTDLLVHPDYKSIVAAYAVRSRRFFIGLVVNALLIVSFFVVLFLA